MIKSNFTKESLYVRAVEKFSGVRTIGICEYDKEKNEFYVQNAFTGEDEIVSQNTICKNTGIFDKNGNMLYEYDLLYCRRLGTEDFFGFIEWSPFYKQYVIRSSLKYGGHYKINDLQIEYIGNVCLYVKDQNIMFEQDVLEEQKGYTIENSYCPSKFKK